MIINRLQRKTYLNLLLGLGAMLPLCQAEPQPNCSFSRETVRKEKKERLQERIPKAKVVKIISAVVAFGLIVGVGVIIVVERKAPATQEKDPPFDLSKRKEEVIQKLSVQGVDLSEVDLNGMTVLHKTVAKDELDIARLIIEARPGLVHQGNDLRETPLHIAVRFGRAGMVRLLLANKADIEAQDHFGDTPLYTAVLWQQSAIARLLIDAKASLVLSGAGQPLLHFAILMDERIAQMLIEAGVDLKEKAACGTTALHCACDQGSLKMVKTLLKAGLDPNAENDFQRTPLHHAVRSNHEEVVRELIKAGADPNKKDCWGKSPLDIARMQHKRHTRKGKAYPIIDILKGSSLL